MRAFSDYIIDSTFGVNVKDFPNCRQRFSWIRLVILVNIFLQLNFDCFSFLIRPGTPEKNAAFPGDSSEMTVHTIP